MRRPSRSSRRRRRAGAVRCRHRPRTRPIGGLEREHGDQPRQTIDRRLDGTLLHSRIVSSLTPSWRARSTRRRPARCREAANVRTEARRPGDLFGCVSARGAHQVFEFGGFPKSCQPLNVAKPPQEAEQKLRSGGNVDATARRAARRRLCAHGAARTSPNRWPWRTACRRRLGRRSPGMETRAALAHDDGPGVHDRAVEHLDPQALGVGVAGPLRVDPPPLVLDIASYAFDVLPAVMPVISTTS